MVFSVLDITEALKTVCEKKVGSILFMVAVGGNGV